MRPLQIVVIISICTIFAYKISKRCSLRNNDYEQKENEEIVSVEYDNEKKNGQDNRNL